MHPIRPSIRHAAAVLLVLPALGLAACAGPVRTAASNPPMSMQSQGTVLITQIPQSPNSLPPGALVLAPLTGVTGQLNSVQVGPMVN